MVAKSETITFMIYHYLRLEWLPIVASKPSRPCERTHKEKARPFCNNEGDCHHHLSKLPPIQCWRNHPPSPHTPDLGTVHRVEPWLKCPQNDALGSIYTVPASSEPPSVKPFSYVLIYAPVMLLGHSLGAP